MTDHLTPENVELVRKALGHCLGRTFNRHEVNKIIDAARAEGLRSPSGGGEGKGLSAALTKAGYLMSEPHLSGHRVILGFDALDDAQAVHVGIADAILRARAAPPSGEAEHER